MFKMELLVEDKNLAKVLRAVEGLVMMERPPHPLRGVAVKRGKAVSTQPQPGAPLRKQLKELIVQRGMQEVSLHDIRALMQELGGAVASATSNLVALRESKFLSPTKKTAKRPGRGGRNAIVYHVNGTAGE